MDDSRGRRSGHGWRRRAAPLWVAAALLAAPAGPGPAAAEAPFVTVPVGVGGSVRVEDGGWSVRILLAGVGRVRVPEGAFAAAGAEAPALVLELRCAAWPEGPPDAGSWLRVPAHPEGRDGTMGWRSPWKYAWSWWSGEPLAAIPVRAWVGAGEREETTYERFAPGDGDRRDRVALPFGQVIRALAARGRIAVRVDGGAARVSVLGEFDAGWEERQGLARVLEVCGESADQAVRRR